MSLLDKASNKLVTICGIEIATVGDIKVSTIEDWQPFYNSIIENADFQKTYIGFGSVSFAEQSTKTNSGTQYKQKLEFRFPGNDEHRSQRLAFFEKLKFIRVLLSNGKSFLIGRNDFNQNAKPKLVIKSNQHISEVEISTVSIFPTGFIPGAPNFGLPSLIPFTLIPTS